MGRILIKSFWHKANNSDRVTGIYKAAIVSVILLLTIYLARDIGQGASRNWLLLVGLGVSGLVGVIILTRWPALGLLVLIPVAFLVKWEFATGTNVSINLVIAVIVITVGIWLARMILFEHQVRLIPSRVNLPALAFIAATTLSLVAGSIRWVWQAEEAASLPAQVGGWMLYVFPILLLLLIGNLVKDISWLKAMVVIFLCMGFILIASYLPGFPKSLGSFIVGAAITSIFRTWVAALALGQALSNNELPRWVRVVLGLMAFFMVYIGWVFSREWISGWLPPIIAIAMIAWLWNWRAGLALTLLGGLLLAPRLPGLWESVMTPTQEYSTISRAATWPIMWELIKTSPILGLGPANYYHYTKLYPLLGWYVVFNSHNNYIDIVAQTGLVGLGIFAWLMWEIGRLGWSLRGQVKDGFSRGYVNAALGGLVATLASGFMADWFLPFLYNIGFPGFRAAAFAWLFLGGLISLEAIQRRTNGEGVLRAAGE